MHFSLVAFVVLATSVVAHNFLISGDDGWATAQARAQYNSLVAAGFDVVLAGTAVAHSGAGDETQKPAVLKTPCQFNTCPKGSPPEGSDPNDPRLNYVNGFGPDAVKYGIQVLAPEFFGGPPDIVIAGPNVPDESTSPGHEKRATATSGASNYETAVEAVKLGIPALAVFGSNTTSVSFTTLTTKPDTLATKAALVNADLTTLISGTLWNSGAPFLPPNIVLYIQIPSIKSCPSVSNFTFVMTKKATTNIASVQTCGRTQLPVASQVIKMKGCFISVNALNATTDADAGVDTQQEVLNRLGGLIGCLP